MTILITILSDPISPEAEGAFVDWAVNTHSREVLDLPGVVGAQVYRISDASAGPPSHSFLTLLELDTDDIPSFQGAMNARAASGRMVMSPSMDWDGFEGHYWVSLTPRLSGPRQA